MRPVIDPGAFYDTIERQKNRKPPHSQIEFSDRTENRSGVLAIAAEREDRVLGGITSRARVLIQVEACSLYIIGNDSVDSGLWSGSWRFETFDQEDSHVSK